MIYIIMLYLIIIYIGNKTDDNNHTGHEETYDLNPSKHMYY